MSDSTSPQPSSTRPGSFSSIFAPRSRKQLSIFFGGAAFLGVATFITRRSLIRRYKASIPRYFQQSNRPSTQFNSGMDAFEALNIATVNVGSVAMMLTGGLLWSFDISSLEDLRVKIRGRLGFDGISTKAEEEFEEWLATALARKERRQENLERGEEKQEQRMNERGTSR